MLIKKSIKDKFRKLITGIVISFALISSLLFFVFAEIQITDKYEHNANGVINLTNLLLETIFEDAERSLLSLEDFLNSDNLDKSEGYYTEILEVIEKGIKSSSTLFMGTGDGSFYLYPKRYVSNDFDPRNRAWYLNSLEDKNSVNWTEPYIDHGTGEFTITASKYVDNRLIIGVDILLSEITRLVNESNIGKNGYVTIVNESGFILASQNKDLLAQNWDEIQNSKVKLSDLKNNSTNMDLKYIYYTKKFEKKNILIIASVSRADIIQNLVFLFFLITMITILIIIFAERVLIKYSDKFVNPILELVDKMEHIEEGRYDVQCDIETDNDEIEVLVNGFNSMILSINEKNLEMQALYEELYASEEALQEQFDLLYENREYILKSEQRYKSIFEASEEGLWDLSKDGIIEYLTPLWYEKFEIDTKNTNLDAWLKLIHPEDRINVESKLKQYIQGDIENYRIEYRVMTKSGVYIWIEAVGIARFENEKYVSISGSHQNITSRKQYELKIHDLAFKDVLTHLFNRRYFEEAFQNILNNQGHGTLLLLDIDNFKYINDIYGHTFGDEVLKQFSKRLLDSVSEFEHKVARFSGNEFIVLIKDNNDKESISFIVNTLIKNIEMPFKSGSKVAKITTSIGITMFPKDGNQVEQLIQNADIAMYYAKRVTKKSFHYFDEEIKQNAINEMKIENHMRSGIEEDEFEVYYQPIMTINDKSVKGFEALVRWNSKSLGFIYPDNFIPIAEKTGLINEIGFIVMEKSCAFLSKLNKQLNSQFTMSVNISVIQLMEEHFANRVLGVIDRYDIPKQLIRLEITESIMLESNENIIAKLYYLKNQNVGILLDDFGTGYTSFKNLIRLPLSGIKIDKAIMKDSISNEHVFTLLESIVDFAHKINIDVVAEGIEDEIYLEKSQNLKVDFVQGYYFSKPVSDNHVLDLIGNLNGLKTAER